MQTGLLASSSVRVVVFGLFPPSTVVPLMFGTLPALILAALAGAKLYRE